MTEQRKIQLATEVDASGAKAGFEEVKQGARDMAQSVAQAGQTAGKGLDAVADGAKRAGDGLTREEGRMRGAIQRATLDLQTLGKTASEKLEAKISLQGLDASKFQPYLTALRQAEQEQARFAQQKVAATFLDGLRGQAAALREQIALQKMSTEEVLRYKAAQAGVKAESVEPLIAELGQLRAAHAAVTLAAEEQAAAERKAAAAVAQRDSFVSRVQAQANSIGKSHADLLAEEAALRGVSAQLAPYIAKIREAEQSHQKFGAGAKLNAFQMQQLGFQMHDFVVQVASGQSAITAFVQQGSQLSGTFGGAGNAFRAILSQVTPLRAAIGGVAVSVGGLALALSHAESAARGLASVQAQLSGTGRSGMFSDAGLKDFLAELALAPGVTREAATSIVSELSKVQGIGGQLFRDLAKASADYAKATGTDAPTAARALAKAFSDPVKGAKELDEALGTLSSSQVLQIERLSRLGDVAGAQRVLFDALQGSIKGLANNAMTPLQKSVNDLGNAWEGALRKLDQSEGLKNLNALLAKTVDLVTFLVNNVDKLGGLGNIGKGMIPGVGLPSAAAGVVTDKLLGGGPPLLDRLFAKPKNPEASGKVTGPDGKPLPVAAVNAVNGEAKATDERVKGVLKETESYRSQAQEIERLVTLRTRLNKAIKEASDPDVRKELQGRLAGVNERIASAQKKGTAGGGNEAQQVLDAQLQQALKASRDAFDRERDELAFSQRFLQGAMQAGEVSLRDFYDKRRQAIKEGVDSEVAELEREREAVQKHLEATKRTSPKDTSSIVRDQTRLQEIDADVERARARGANELKLTNQEAAASFKQLNEEVENYRANLLQLQGDEEGAARIRAQLAIQQARNLSTRNAGEKVDVSGLQSALNQQIALTAAKERTFQINDRLAQTEDRIALAVRTGAISELDALTQSGAARAKAVAELEKIVQAQEEIARTRPEDYQLQIDTSRARLELDKLKAELDPLKEKFDNLFKDAGGNFFTDLLSGTKAKDALRNFANTIAKNINDTIGKELSQQVFGKGGLFGQSGGIGGLFADLFGGKDRAQHGWENALPGTLSGANSFDDGAMAKVLGLGGGDAAAAALEAAGATTALASAETAASAAINAASSSSSAALASMTAAAQAAAAALQAVAASGGGGSGGGLGGLGGLLGASSGGDFGTGADFGFHDYGLFFSEGGYTGKKDRKKPAGVVHGDEYVFSAPAVAAIGVDRLERMHKKAKAGRLEDDDIPGYSEGGYVSTRPITMSRTAQYLTPPASVKSGDTYVTDHHYNVTVNAPPGMSRQTALQMGREAARGIEASKRNGPIR